MRKRIETEFTYTETPGIQPISDWLQLKALQLIREEYGFEVTAALNPAYRRRGVLSGESQKGVIHS